MNLRISAKFYALLGKFLICDSFGEKLELFSKLDYLFSKTTDNLLKAEIEIKCLKEEKKLLEERLECQK